MGDDTREDDDFGMGSPDGESPDGIDDTESPQGDSNRSGKRALGFVYFFETKDEEYIKIGYSANVSQRMGQVSTLVPMRLLGYFPGSRDTELHLHTLFAKDRYAGEWFKSSDELRKVIAGLNLHTSGAKSALDDDELMTGEELYSWGLCADLGIESLPLDYSTIKRWEVDDFTIEDLNRRIVLLKSQVQTLEVKVYAWEIVCSAAKDIDDGRGLTIGELRPVTNRNMKSDDQERS